MEETKSFNIFEALGYSFKVLKSNYDVLKKVYTVEFLFLFLLGIISLLIENMTFLGKLIGSIILIGVSIFYSALIIAFEWNVLYNGIMKKKLRLREPFMWKSFWDYFIALLLLNLLIFFAILLPILGLSILMGYGLYLIKNNLFVSFASVGILVGLLSVYFSIKLFFVKLIIAEKVTKNRKIKYWQTIKESFKL